MNIKNTIGERIRNARIKQGLKQTELSKCLSEKNIKVGSTAISNWETGQTSPDIDTFYMLCKILDVTPSYLLDLEEDNSNKIQLTSNEKSLLNLTKDFTPEQLRELENYANYLKNKR